MSVSMNSNRMNATRGAHLVRIYLLRRTTAKEPNPPFTSNEPNSATRRSWELGEKTRRDWQCEINLCEHYKDWINIGRVIVIQSSTGGLELVKKLSETDEIGGFYVFFKDFCVSINRVPYH